MASLTWWTWVSVNCGSWWWTGRPGVLRFTGSQGVGHELSDWSDLIWWCCRDFPGGSGGKASAYNAGDPGLIPGSGRSPGEGNGTPLQYSCLENPMDRGVWWATVHRATESRTWLSNFTFTFFLWCCKWHYFTFFLWLNTPLYTYTTFSLSVHLGCLYVFTTINSAPMNIGICLQCRRHWFDSWVGKILWRRSW